MISRILMLLGSCLCVVTGAPPQRTGKFKISDSGVNGEGSYVISNSTAEIGLHLIIGSRTTPVQPVNPTITPIPAPVSNGTRGQTVLQQNTPAKATGNPQEVVLQATSQALPRPLTVEVKGKQPSQEHQPATASPDRRPGQDLQLVVQQENGREKQGNGEKNGALLNDDEIAFMREGLAEHNKYRTIHNAVPLNLNQKMCQEAQMFAQQLAQLGTLKHSARDSRPGEGENLAMGCSSTEIGMSAASAVKKWYDEVCKYDFTNKTFQRPAGHFSQVIWKSTQELGMGRAQGTKWGMNCTFIVARYAPIGNIANATMQNVDKGSFDQSYCSTVARAKLEKKASNSEEVTGDENKASYLEEYPGYYSNYNGMNEEFLDEEGERLRSVGYRGKIPRYVRIRVL